MHNGNGHFFHPYRVQQQQQRHQPGQGDWNAFHQRQMQMVADPMPMPDDAQRRQMEMDAYVQRQEERIRKLLNDQRVKDQETEEQRRRSNATIETQNNEKAELQKKNDELHRNNADLKIDLDIAHRRLSDQNLKLNAYEQKFGVLDSTEGASSSLPSVAHPHQAFPYLPSTSDDDILHVPVDAFKVVVQSWTQWWSIHERQLPGVDEAWAQLNKEERMEWKNHCETLKMWQTYQIQHGWIVHKQPTVKKEPVAYGYPS